MRSDTASTKGESRRFSVFIGTELVADGDIETVVLQAKARIDSGVCDQVAVFEDETGSFLDVDFQGTPAEVVARLADHPMLGSSVAAKPKRSGPGRPKLGVVSREVSLLPRHWDWLSEQRGGASATLRRLVDEARKQGLPQQRALKARDATHRFMWTMAGDYPHFEDASRAFFRGDYDGFFRLIEPWPVDIRDHVKRLAERTAKLQTGLELGPQSVAPQEDEARH